MDEFGFERVCPVALRQVGEGDRAFVEGLYLATTEPLLKPLGRWDRSAAEARVARSLRRHPSRIICQSGRAVGWLQVSQTPSGFHLNQVHVAPPFRNRGIGSCLIRRILARGRVTQSPVTLNVIIGNQAVRLYERVGFRVVDAGAELVQMRWDPTSAVAG